MGSMSIGTRYGAEGTNILGWYGIYGLSLMAAQPISESCPKLPKAAQNWPAFITWPKNNQKSQHFDQNGQIKQTTEGQQASKVRYDFKVPGSRPFLDITFFVENSAPIIWWAAGQQFWNLGRHCYSVGRLGRYPQNFRKPSLSMPKKIKKSNNFRKPSCPKNILHGKTFENHGISWNFRKPSLNMDKNRLNFRKPYIKGFYKQKLPICRLVFLWSMKNVRF